MKSRFFKKLPPLLVIIFITGVLAAVVYTPFAEAQPSLPTLNGYALNATQSKWVQYIAENVVPLLPGSPDEKAAMAARGTWWSLKEGVVDVTSPENPIGYSNCQVAKDGSDTGNNHIGFIEDYCPQNVLWQVGIAAVQVPYQDDAAVKTAAAESYPGMSYKDIIAKVATLAGHPEGSLEYNGAINSTGYLQKSLLLRDPAIGLTLGYDDIVPCLDAAKRAALKQDWCQGYGAAGSIAKDVDTTNKVIGELASYYKNFASGATPVVAPPADTGEQKEIPLGLPQQIGKFYAFALGIGGLVALGVLIFGGILYTVSAGNASREEDAKQWITGSIIGLIILFGSWFILNTINPELTKLTDLKLLANKIPQGLPDSGGEDTTGGGGFGGSTFLVNNLPIQVQTPSCASYNFAQTSFNVPQASCPVYALAPGFSYGDDFCSPRDPGTAGGLPIHHATDIFAEEGSPIYAFEGGRVYKKGWNDCGGNRLWIEGGSSGLQYYYAHLQSFAPGIGENTKVPTGALIGSVGNTGCAAGTPYHLHFEVYPPGSSSYGINAINPKPILDQVCKAVPGGTPAESPGLAQVLDQPEYNKFGVAVLEVGGTEAADINSAQSFPSASLYKLFVAQWLYDQREKGKLSFNQKIPLVNVARNIAENNADGVGFLKTPSDPVSINDCLPRMIKYSDNICGWALRDYALKGGLDSYLNGQGYDNTSVNGLTTSAADVAKLLTKVADGQMVNQSASNELYSLMRQQYHQNKIPKGVPAGAEVANKTGELHGSNYSHDAAIIKYNGKNYILVITTPLDPDISSTNQTIQQLTRELFNALKK